MMAGKSSLHCVASDRVYIDSSISASCALLNDDMDRRCGLGGIEARVEGSKAN